MLNKHITAIFTGALVAMLVNSYVLYKAATYPHVECVFETTRGNETHVRMGYAKKD